MPNNGSKLGVDDFVAAFGAPAFADLVEQAEPWLWGSDRTIRQLRARVRELEQERSAIFALLRNEKFSATERLVGVSVICSTASRLSRGQEAPLRVTIDAPKDPQNPEDPERVGVATEIGLGKNTVGRALDVVFWRRRRDCQAHRHGAHGERPGARAHRALAAGQRRRARVPTRNGGLRPEEGEAARRTAIAAVSRAPRR